MENRSDDVNTLINFGANINYIPDKAFYDKDITNITIPNCIEIIGYLSFANNQLTNISLPNSIIFIDHGAFLSNSLINLEIPQSVSVILSKAFEDNPLTKVTLPYLFKHDVSAIFDNENIFTQILFNHVPYIMQRRLHVKGLNMVILPMKI
jgi:hypothetical protein